MLGPAEGLVFDDVNCRRSSAADGRFKDKRHATQFQESGSRREAGPDAAGTFGEAGHWAEGDGKKRSTERMRKPDEGAKE